MGPYARGEIENIPLASRPPGIGEIAVALFIFTTIFFSEGAAANVAAKFILIGAFCLGVLSGRKIVFNPFVIAGAAFLAFSAASVSWTVATEATSARVSTLIFQFACYLALTNLLIWRKRRLELGLTMVVISALASGAYVILLRHVTFQDVRSAAGLLAAGQLAFACAAGMIISIYRFNKARKARYLACFAVLGIFLAFTSARRGFLLVVFFLALFHLFGSRTFGRRLGSILLAVVLVAGSYELAVNIPFLYQYVGSRLQSFVGEISGSGVGDASSQGRLSLINFGYSLFRGAPYFGHGIDSFNALFSVTHGSWQTSADNNYVELLVDLGVVGFLIYYVPLFLFLVRGVRGVSQKALVVRFSVAAIFSMALIDFATVWPFSKVGMLMFLLFYQGVYQSEDYDSLHLRRRDSRASGRWRKTAMTLGG